MEPEHAEGLLKEDSWANLGGRQGKDEDVAAASSSTSSSSSSLPSISGLESSVGDSGRLYSSTFKPQSDRIPSDPELISSPEITSQAPQSSTANSPLVLKNQSPESLPMKSPPVQTMGQPLGYDPNRIPSSVFSTKRTNTTEWSTASNESLFSLRMGNNSFSNDSAILFGKSGELLRSEDWNNSPLNSFRISGELPRLNDWNNNALSNPQSQAKSDDPSNLPAAVEAPSNRVLSGKHSGVENRDDGKNSASYMDVEAKVKPTTDAKRPPDVQNAAVPEAASPPPSISLTFPSPRCSEESGNSRSSFAFPVLVNDGGRNGSSLKKPEEPQIQPQPQPQSPKESPQTPTKLRWCSCFSCFPQCC